MKKLLAFALLILPLAAKAQTVTNIAWRITVEIGTVGGSTNSVNSNLRLDYGVAKDLTRINGWVFAWNTSTASRSTTSTLGDWIKTDTKDRSDSYAAVKQANDNTSLVAKLTALLLQNPDLLSAADFTNLQTIAAKAP